MNGADGAAALFGSLMVTLFAGLIGVVLMIIVYWKMFARTGRSGALSLLMLVPVVNIIMPFVLAFGRWPIEEELEQYRAWQRNNAAGPPR